MTLIVEDGSNVTNANSFCDLTFIKQFANDRGITLGSDAVIEDQSFKAMDYLEGKRKEYQGIKTYPDQFLQFPRMYVLIDDLAFPQNSIPIELKKAQSQLIIEQTNGVNILPTMSDAPIKKETVGPISTEYAVSNGDINQPVLTAVDLFLQPLLKVQSSSGFALTTIRV